MDDILRIAMVCEYFEGIGMFPTGVDKFLNIVLTAIAESLVVGEWVRLLSL